MKRQILLRGKAREDADLLYFTGFSAPDPFFAFTAGGKKCALLGALEIGRARRSSKLDEIFDLTELSQKTPKSSMSDEVSVLCRVLRKLGVRELLVSANFPSGIFEKLKAAKFDVEISTAPLFPERDIKTKRELREIEKACAVAAEGYAAVERVLRRSRMANGSLVYKDKPLTSEFLRAEIERIALELEADACDTIVACGDQACDPHETGRGKISANSLIVVDIFPRLRASGYYGDMTRTFLKGRPSDAQRRLVETVMKAQRVALSYIKEGVNGAYVHSKVRSLFDSTGYKTSAGKSGWSGFFHSTGHGVGLEIHEGVSLGRRDCILKAGNVVTVEPGLYYKGIGGCRIEDTVVVGKKRPRELSKYHYNWVVD